MKVRNRKIKVSENESFIMLEDDDFEFKNPYHYYQTITMSSTMAILDPLLKSNFPEILDSTLQKFLFKQALSGWNQQLRKYQNLTIPQQLIRLLSAKSKKEQVSLLKGLKISMDQLIAFFLYAFDNHNYTLSQYRVIHDHSNLESDSLPKFSYLEDEKVKTMGESNLTEGEIKQAIKHRKIQVARFIDNGNEWHCFFLTSLSVRGKERIQNGSPHIHYISNKWTLSRQMVLEQLKSKKYSLPSVPHIELVREEE